MSNIPASARQWNERSNAGTVEMTHSQSMFRTLFERSADAMSLFDPQTQRFVESNAAVAQLIGAPSRQALGNPTAAEMSPERQPDGRLSREKAEEMARLALANGSHRFEWLARHLDGTELPLDIVMTSIPDGERPLLLVVARDISAQKRAESESLRLNASLEMRVAERTIELVETNSQLMAEIRERHRREAIQRALFQISEAVHAVGNLDSLYARIHAIVKSVMPAENFYIALRDPAADSVSFAYWANEFEPAPPLPRPADEGRTGEVLRTGKPLLSVGKPGARSAENVDAPSLGSTHRTAIWLGAPLMSQDAAFGAMVVGDYRSETAYGENEKNLLTFIAEQTALAILRKRAEQELRARTQSLQESEAKFRALFEASSQGVILHDQDRMMEVNPACLRILGFQEAGEIVGKHPADTSAPIQPNGEPAAVLAKKHIEDCMATGSKRFEWVARNSHGADVPIEVILTRIEWCGRQIIQAVFNDISERKRAEAELLRTLAREKELGQLRSNFVSMVSHEFRTPLGIMQSSAEILEGYLEKLTPAERTEHLESIRKNTRRMAGLMEEVLLIGSIEAGKLAFTPRPIDLRPFAGRLVNEVLAATDRRCSVELSVDAPATLQADERLLGHIFTNLLTNAVKYSEPGSTVQFRVDSEGKELVFVVADHGIGIPQQDQEWLFHAFHRGRNVGNRPGTGLGLVIVKRCVDLHGGSIHIASAEGKGTTITVRLSITAPS